MRKRIRNLGFSLIELIVAFAILGIATLGIGSLYVSSARSSSSINSQSQLQNEAQLAMSQIKNLIVDAELGVNYKVVTTNGGNFVLSDSDSAITGDITSKTLYIFKTDESGQLVASLLKWEKDSQEIQLQQMAVDVSSVTSVEAIEPSAGSWELLAEGVEAFVAEIDKDGGKIKLSASFTSGKNSYSTNDTITLRNKVLVGESSLATMTEGINVVVQDKVTKATVTVNPSVVAPGGGCNLTKNIEGTGDLSGFGYKWLVGTDAKMDTLLSSTIAEVSGDDLIIHDLDQITGSIYLQVIVDADKDSNMTNDSDDVKSNVAELKIIKNIRVGIKDVNADEADLANVGSYATTTGMTYNMYTKFDTKASLSNSETRIKWSISDCDTGVIAAIDADGKVTIDKTSKAGTFYVVATLAKNSSVSVKYLFSVKNPYEETDKLIITGPTTINRGEEAQFSATLNGYAVSPSDIEWSIKGSSANGITIGSSGVVTVERDVEWNKTYNLEVSAKLKRDTSVQCETAGFNVPKVEIKVNGPTEGSRGNSYDYTCTVTGLKDYEVDWSFAMGVYDESKGEAVRGNWYGQRGNTKIEENTSNQCKAKLTIGEDEPGELWYINVKAELLDKAGYESIVTIYTKPSLNVYITQEQITYVWGQIGTILGSPINGWKKVSETVTLGDGDDIYKPGLTDNRTKIYCDVTNAVAGNEVEWTFSGTAGGYQLLGNLYTDTTGTLTISAEYCGVKKSITVQVVNAE